MRKSLRCAAAALICLLILTAAAPCLAAEPGKTVRVGCVDIDNFFMPNADGTYSGYGAEYLEKIAEYTRWQYEYVPGTWNECTQWLQEGKIDLLFPAEYSEERAEKFDFSSQELFIDYVTLLTRVDNVTLFYEDYASFQGIRIGMIAGNYLNDQFDAYAEAHDFAFTPVSFNTNADLMTALRGGVVDAVVQGNLMAEDDVKVLDKFAYLPVYFITGKGNSELMDTLNDAMCRIWLEEPYFSADLIKKYYGKVARQPQSDTREEKEFVVNSGPLTVACDPDNYPFEWYDEDEKRFRGVSIDVMDRIAEQAGLQFTYLKTDSQEAAWKAVRDGRADLIAGVYGAQDLKTRYRLTFTDSYLDDTCVAVARRNAHFDSSRTLCAAVLSCDIGMQEYLRANYPDWESVGAQDITQCLELVDDGRADLTFLSARTLQTIPYLEDYPTLSAYSGLYLELPLCIGVSDSQPELLDSVLNKSIKSLTKQQLSLAEAENSLARKQVFSLRTWIRHNRFTAAAVVLGTILLAALLILLLEHSHAKACQAMKLAEANRKLEDTARRANEACDAKSQFLSRMSHDMRTPMNAIIGLSGIALEESADPKAAGYLEEIRMSGQYLMSLMDDVLDMSRIENGKMTLEYKWYTAVDFVQFIRAVIQPQMDADGIQFDFRTDQLRDRIYTDPMRFNQIFVNLLSNAAKFTPRGGTVAFCAEGITLPDGKPARRFYVRDTGVGMSAEFLRHCFEPFSQEKNDHTKPGAGTGLGLSIVKSLSELLGGTVSVTSRIGAGAEFVVTLPLLEGPEEETADTLGGAERVPDGDGRTILLAEDHPLNIQVAVRLLEKRHYHVRCARNGQEAVELFGASQPGDFDAIVMDLRMPVLDGMGASRAIRAMKRPDAGSIPIIALTADTLDDVAARCREAAMDAHLSKPVDAVQLYRTLGSLIAERESVKKEKMR